MIVRNLSGAFDLILGRPVGLQKLDLSADGFWRSFVGLGLAGLIDAFVIYWSFPLRSKMNETTIDNPLVLVAALLVIAIAAYFASMVALYFLCRTADVQSRFPNAFIANNWAAPLVSIAFAPVAVTSYWLAQQGDPAEPGMLSIAVIFGALAVLVVIGIRLLRFSLDISPAHASGLFFASAAVSWILEGWLSGLLGV